MNDPPRSDTRSATKPDSTSATKPDSTSETKPAAAFVRPVRDFWDPPQRRRRERRVAKEEGVGGHRRIILVVAGAVLFAVIVLYFVGYLLAGDRLPKNARISGVPVGGLSRAQAVDKLSTELDGRAEQPMAVLVGDQPATLAPADAGLRIDYTASVAAAGGGKSFDPRKIFTVLTGGLSTEVVVAADNVKLARAVQSLAVVVDHPPVDATLGYLGTQIRQTPGRTGVTLQQDGAATTIREGFLQTSTPIALPATVAPPEILDEEANQVVATFAKPAVSAPVRVTTGGSSSFAVTPAMIAGATTFVPKDGTLAPVLDAAKLRSSANAAVQRAVRGKPRNATVRLVKGRPKVIAAVDGAAVSAEELLKAVFPVLAKSGTERTAAVRLTSTKAKFSTDAAGKLGIKEVTGRFTTYFPYVAYRNVNLGRAAAKINNTVLKPGQTFSFNRIVGKRTRANGFTDGYEVVGGRNRKQLGGGVSQSAVTAYNAMFFAGLKDVYHRPHPVYVSRYPAGREATVGWSGPDLKFKNDTKFGVLVQAYVVKGSASRRGSITVKMWSTKGYDTIRATPTRRSNVRDGKTVRDRSSDCVPTSAAPGFDAAYERVFYRNATVVKRQKYRWHYGPTNKVVCG